MYIALQWNPLIIIYFQTLMGNAWSAVVQINRAFSFQGDYKAYLETFLKCPIIGVRLEVRG